MTAKIKDRIKDFRRVPAESLKANPKNWRVHPPEQSMALASAFEQIGIADAVLARELPDGSLELVDGHLRAETAAGAEIPVLVLDVTEEEADTLLATLDPLAAMADQNASKLNGLLSQIQVEGDELRKMLNSLAGDSGLFEVSLEPTSTAANVTIDEINKKQAELEGRFDGNVQDIVEITCPHCGGDFNIDRP